MKRRYLAIPLVLGLICSGRASEQETIAKQTYSLPAPHKWDTRQTLQCQAVSSTSLHQKGLIETDDKNTLIAEAKPGSDKIELTLVGNTLLLHVKMATPTNIRSLATRNYS
jgi:hypothetical protein